MDDMKYTAPSREVAVDLIRRAKEWLDLPPGKEKTLAIRRFRNHVRKHAENPLHELQLHTGAMSLAELVKEVVGE